MRKFAHPVDGALQEVLHRLNPAAGVVYFGALEEAMQSGRLAGPELDRFRRRLEAGPTPEDGICTFYGPDLRLILEREFGVLLGQQAVYDLLHRHGFSSLMPRPQHKDADEELQAIFKEVILDQIRAIREAHPGEDVRVWFEDEARFGQQGTLARVRARKGSRPAGAAGWAVGGGIA